MFCNHNLFTLIFIAIIPILTSCSADNMNIERNVILTIQDIPQKKWDELSQKKIYFGHQSVGYNIIDGLGKIISAHPEIRLNIVKTNNPSSFDHPIFAHSEVGKNENPITKINEFSDFINSGIGSKVDVAFYKFCYIDVNSDTDINGLFTEYKNRYEIYKSKFPNTIFVHLTIPITVVQKGPKAWIKKIIGKPIGGYDDNIKRNEFNKLLTKEYPADRVFDLAKYESTSSDGLNETFSYNGKTYFALFPGYAYEKVNGRHLNTNGRSFIAEQLLIFLANNITSK